MDFDDAVQAWHDDGYVILPEFVPAGELRPALAELDLMFPPADGFHDGTDPRRDRFIGDEFAGIARSYTRPRCLVPGPPGPSLPSKPGHSTGALS